MARTPRKTTSKKKKPESSDGIVEVYEGRDVLQTTLQVTNAGDGLSEAMAVEPTVLHHQQTVYLVLECVVSKVSYPPIKDTDCLARMHTLKAGRATLVDGDLVLPAINDQHLRIVAARDAVAGQGALDLEKRNLRGDHGLGEHKDGLVEGCELCDEELAAEAAGR